MKRAIAGVLAFLSLTVSMAWGEDAMDFYNLGLSSSLACKRIEYFSKAIQLDPHLVEAYEKRAVHYYFQNHLDQAIQDYTTVIELRPHRLEPYLMRGTAYLRKGHPQGLFAEINRLAPSPGGMDAAESRLLLEKAIADLSRAIELNGRLARAYSYRAQAHRLMGMTEEAMRDATTAIGLEGHPQSIARAYRTRAEIHRELGRSELYKADFLASVQLDPYTQDYPPLHVPLMPGYPAGSASPQMVRQLGLVAVIVLAFVVIFRLGLPAPHKGDRD
ncbi:MAG: tetratricopeptide repeat protein [Syntrophobacteria bacterium]